MIVYMTRRNADMIEGRGPMVNDLCFFNREDAAAYIDVQPGCMGRMAKWSDDKYGDWDIVEIEVLMEAFDPEEEKRKKALAKLSKEERILLGLEKEENKPASAWAHPSPFEGIGQEDHDAPKTNVKRVRKKKIYDPYS